MPTGAIQHTNHACRQYIKDAGARASYAWPGNPYDNAQGEAGRSIPKTELLPHNEAFTSLGEARLEVAYYFDIYFNLNRRYSALGYRSPHQFDAALLSHLP